MLVVGLLVQDLTSFLVLVGVSILYASLDNWHGGVGGPLVHPTRQAVTTVDTGYSRCWTIYARDTIVFGSLFYGMLWIA